MTKTIIIAEAGVNHNGDFEKAKQLVKVAALAGADFVKFQTFRADKITSKSAQKADYQTKNVNDGDNSQFAMLKKLEMPHEWHIQLKKYANELDIQFLSTAFDHESIDYLNELEQPFFKIPSGEITNKPYLQHLASIGKPVILSTGMANISEIDKAVNVLLEGGLKKDDITILHCNTEYPTPMEDVNLKAMLHIQREFDVKIGYSDHTLGVEVPIAAVALGAQVIEKHFTLDRSLPGPDHAASLEPDELKDMVQAIRNIEKAVGGSGIKEPSKSEQKNISIARKSIHLSKEIQKGHELKMEDLIMRRPGDGISPMEVDKVLGKRTNSSLDEDTKLEWSHLD